MSGKTIKFSAEAKTKLMPGDFFPVKNNKKVLGKTTLLFPEDGYAYILEASPTSVAGVLVVDLSEKEALSYVRSLGNAVMRPRQYVGTTVGDVTAQINGRAEIFPVNENFVSRKIDDVRKRYRFSGSETEEQMFYQLFSDYAGVVGVENDKHLVQFLNVSRLVRPSLGLKDYNRCVDKLCDFVTLSGGVSPRDAVFSSTYSLEPKSRLQWIASGSLFLCGFTNISPSVTTSQVVANCSALLPEEPSLLGCFGDTSEKFADIGIEFYPKESDEAKKAVKINTKTAAFVTAALFVCLLFYVAWKVGWIADLLDKVADYVPMPDSTKASLKELKFNDNWRHRLDKDAFVEMDGKLVSARNFTRLINGRKTLWYSGKEVKVLDYDVYNACVLKVEGFDVLYVLKIETFPSGFKLLCEDDNCAKVILNTGVVWHELA